MQADQDQREARDVVTSLIHVTDTATRQSWAFPKSTLVDPGDQHWLMTEILSRPKDFVLLCGCKKSNRAVLYARRHYRRSELCNRPSPHWDHSPSCAYWTQPPRLQQPESRTSEDRSLGLRRLFNVQELGGRPLGEDDTTKQHKSTPRKYRISGPSSLAGALIALLDFAGLNHFTPGRSTSSWARNAVILSETIHSLLKDRPEATSPRVVAKGLHLRLFDLPFSPTKSFKRVRPLLILGKITQWSVREKIVVLQVNGFAHDIQISIQDWHYAIKRSPSRHTKRALNNLGASPRSAKVVALCEITRDESYDVIAHRVGLCTTSAELMPVESSHELTMTNFLVDQNRTFVKDLYIPDGHRFRHDFRLLDTEQEFFIEVNGMNTQRYNAGKEAVIEHLNRNCAGRYLIWRAAFGDPLPQLPSPLD